MLKRLLLAGAPAPACECASAGQFADPNGVTLPIKRVALLESGSSRTVSA